MSKVLFKTERLVKVTIHWKGEDTERDAFHEWQEKHRIYPARGSAFSSEEREQGLYRHNEADLVEAYMFDVAEGRRCSILPS